MTGLNWSTPAQIVFIRDGIPATYSAVDELKGIVRSAMALPPGMTYGLLINDGQCSTAIEPHPAAELFEQYRREFPN